VKEGATVVSTSTRNFPNRLGRNTNVYLASAELAAVASKLGRIPTLEEYRAETAVVASNAETIYRYMNFDTIPDYVGAQELVRK
jgi:aconitate hydratase 2/2-methylisocitrate dehydratase